MSGEKVKKIFRFDYNNLYPLFFTVVFILLLIQYSFNSLEAIFYDFWVRADVFNTQSNKIVIVTLDEESDQFLGEVYPYTYTTHNRFIDKLTKDNPKVVNYFVPFFDPEKETEKKAVNSFYNKLVDYKQGGGGFRFGTDRDAWGEQIPPEGLIDLGYSLALINKDGNIFSRDDITRRAILNISGEDSLHVWTSKFYSESEGKKQIDPTKLFGTYYNPEVDATFTLFKYASSTLPEKTKYKTIPFHRVVVGNYPPNFFKDKIVLVGPQYYSNIGDFVLTPFSREQERSPKMLVHANMIEAIIGGKTIYQLPNWFTDTLSIILAIILSFVISRLQPTKGLMITILFMAVLFFSAWSLFAFFGVWLKIAHVVLSVFVVYYIWVPFRAIGEYQTRYAIQEEAKILKKVDNLKQNFISLMSHDLKTPVAKIAGIADLLKTQYDNSPQQVQHIDNIVTSTRELNNFISSILDLTKVESRNIILNRESKDVNPLIELAVKSLEYEANQNKMKIVTNLEPLYPIQIDATLVKRAISNIVGNAIKYAGDGSTIEIKSWDDEEWVYIEISDNGVGIGEEELENIFEKFYRVKNDDSHKIKGSGLGLYLVKYFIELHQGSIHVESTKGEGTKFTIKLVNK
jgi:signal transduction histidine kinase